MTKRVAIINPTGFYVGGAITLCVQYAKLGLDVYIRDYVVNKKPQLPEHMKTFGSNAELVDIASRYERLILLDLFHGDPQKDTLDVFIEIKNKYPNIEICLLYTNRNFNVLNKINALCTENNFEFSHIITLNRELDKVVDSDKLTITRINAFSPDEYDFVDIKYRDNIVFTSGRVEAFKGITKLFSSIDDKFDMNGYAYIHNGATFNFNKTGSVSCPLQLMCVFDTTSSPKKIKEPFRIKKDTDVPTINKFNIYGEYCLDDIKDSWRHHYAGICCILGTKSKCVKQSGLFGDKYTISDTKESSHILKSLQFWNLDLEYTDLEKLELKIPILFSRTYATLINFNDDRLIYDSFSDIPSKIESLSDYYEDAVAKQQLWYRNNIASVNENIVKVFTGDFNDK